MGTHVSLLLLFLHAPVLCAGDAEYFRYVILGAGPGGLQLAHYLSSARRDYLVLEQSQAAASFFSHYPRWRQLISINKREVGRVDSLAFAERHDWNSLLTDASHSAGGLASSTDARLTLASQDARLRFGNWSNEYFPMAQDLVSFLSFFASAAAAAGNASHAGLGRTESLRIRYGVSIASITRPREYAVNANSSSSSSSTPRFLLTSSTGQTFACKYLILATGLQKAVEMPSAAGRAAVASGLVQTYATAPTSPEAYRGKRVLLLGHGNAAWEFAHHTLGVAAYVHVVGRPTSRVKLALETHYPGNVRAVHGTLLETYNLKSLDGITAAPLERLTFAPAANGSVRVSVGGVGASSTCTLDSLGRATSRCAFRRPYDIVVACLGWTTDLSIFPEGATRPALAPSGKHPAATPRFEAPNLPGLFFAGTLAHSLDFKRASGGFIHGFRYTARALHRFLEEEEMEAARGGASAALPVGVQPEGGGGAGGGEPLGAPPPQPWPATPTRTLRGLVALLLRRLNGAAGLYQMFGHLCDVHVLNPLKGPRGLMTAPSPHAAMQHPWEYFDEEAEAAAQRGSDPSGLAADVAALQARRRAPPQPSALASKHLLHAARAREGEGAINAALAGALREEVPVGAAAAAARAWSAAAAGAAGAAAEWIQVTLEFGPSAPPGQKDPFALDRADVGLRAPERSHFLHPVLKYFHGGAPGCGGESGAVSSSSSSSGSGSGSNGTAPCAPLAELHLIEDSHAEWVLHTAHILPLGRWLQHLGFLRARGAAAEPWAPPRPPLAFFQGLLTQFMSGCDGASWLFWGGVGFAAEGEADGWWLKMSIAAEASLEGLRGLAVHALDAAAGVPLTQEEEAHTEGVRAAWASFGGGGEGTPEGAALAAAAGRPAPPPASPGHASAVEHAYGGLTERIRGLGVLAVDARAGACRVLAERNGVRAGGVRVFFPDQAVGRGEYKGLGVAVEAEGPLAPGEAVKHIKKITQLHLK